MSIASISALPTVSILRMLAGLALIANGLGTVGGTAGWALAAVGLVPLFAGALNRQA